MKRKKIYFLLIIFIVLFFGIMIGNQRSIGKNNYFEQAKEEFENNITEKDNENSSLPITIEGDTLNKVAKKIDETIYTIIRRVLNQIAGS